MSRNINLISEYVMGFKISYKKFDLKNLTEKFLNRKLLLMRRQLTLLRKNSRCRSNTKYIQGRDISHFWQYSQQLMKAGGMNGSGIDNDADDNDISANNAEWNCYEQFGGTLMVS